VSIINLIASFHTDIFYLGSTNTKTQSRQRWLGFLVAVPPIVFLISCCHSRIASIANLVGIRQLIHNGQTLFVGAAQSALSWWLKFVKKTKNGLIVIWIRVSMTSGDEGDEGDEDFRKVFCRRRLANVSVVAKKRKYSWFDSAWAQLATVAAWLGFIGYTGRIKVIITAVSAYTHAPSQRHAFKEALVASPDAVLLAGPERLVRRQCYHNDPILVQLLTQLKVFVLIPASVSEQKPEQFLLTDLSSESTSSGQSRYGTVHYMCYRVVKSLRENRITENIALMRQIGAELRQQCNAMVAVSRVSPGTGVITDSRRKAKAQAVAVALMIGAGECLCLSGTAGRSRTSAKHGRSE
jgi:hypothetical protein